MGRTPKEDPQDKAARLRERRISQMERDSATQRTAGELTADLRSVYGLRGLPLTFGSAPMPVVPAQVKPKTHSTSNSSSRFG
jgi:hypothetical protein